MAHLGLLNHKFSFLEFGAGRGGLTRAICLGLGDKGNQTDFLLVDRAGNRNKVFFSISIIIVIIVIIS